MVSKIFVYGTFGAIFLLCMTVLTDGAPASLRPNSKLTPGATLHVTVAQISQYGYTQGVRDVPPELKQRVYNEYHIRHRLPREYEVDHLIPLELGGSNALKNLWPESYRTSPWNAHVKDKLENKLHELVCSGDLDLTTAQHAIATDWIAAYQHYMHRTPSRHKRLHAVHSRRYSSTKSRVVPVGADIVWVNTETGVYHYKGDRWFGHTRHGKFITERDAIRSGDTAAKIWH